MPKRRSVAYLLSVHGADRPGIVSAVTAQVAAVGGNITDLTTRLTGDLYVLLAEVDLPEALDHALFTAHLRALRAGLPVAPPRYCFATHRRIGTGPVFDNIDAGALGPSLELLDGGRTKGVPRHEKRSLSG